MSLSLQENLKKPLIPWGGIRTVVFSSKILDICKTKGVLYMPISGFGQQAHNILNESGLRELISFSRNDNLQVVIFDTPVVINEKDFDNPLELRFKWLTPMLYLLYVLKYFFKKSGQYIVEEDSTEGTKILIKNHLSTIHLDFENPDDSEQFIREFRKTGLLGIGLR